MMKMNESLREVTRRHFFKGCGVGLGKIALASMLAEAGGAALGAGSRKVVSPLAPKSTHYAPKAKSVIHIFMAGAPSQLELFDYKPLLAKNDGKSIPAEIVKDQRYAFIQRDARMLAPRFKFKKHGQSGAEFSSVIPHLGEIADDITIIKSMHTEQFNHAPAQLFLNTGSPLPGRPAIGAWVTYGIGSESKNLPGFVVLSSGGGTSAGTANWASGFLPTHYQGVPFRSKGDPILNVSNPAGVDNKLQRDSLNLIGDLNAKREEAMNDPEIRARINAYELAWRMQASAPELMDIGKEPKHVMDMYGAKVGAGSFANNCLLARRLVERGVRFVNIYQTGWDHHSNVEGGLKNMCRATDKPVAALVKDLKQRGMLEDTLVVWGGEFGRTPMVESNAALGRKLGRDHHPQAFTVWMAGPGLKPGLTIGQTDDLGFHVTKDAVHVHDLQATILHLLGLDHTKLTFTFQGRPFRLTDVFGKHVDKILA